jgi:hypothetical protein
MPRRERQDRGIGQRRERIAAARRKEGHAMEIGHHRVVRNGPKDALPEGGLT